MTDITILTTTESNEMFDYEEYLNSIESDVRTRFTKLKHKAKLMEYKSADGQTITTLDWRRADGAGDHYVRYVFDGGTLYITGDLGDAVFYFWDGLTYDNATLLKHNDWRYIKSKCLTSEDIWWFDEKIALQETDDWARRRTDTDNAPSEEWLEICSGAIKAVKDCIDEYGESFSHALWFNDDFSAYLRDCPDDYETVCDFGKVYSWRYLSWFIGLEMAVTQLKENHTEGE